jgi:hypothetical protein
MESVTFQISTKAVEKFMGQTNIDLWLRGNSALFASVCVKIGLARLLLVEALHRISTKSKKLFTGHT